MSRVAIVAALEAAAKICLDRASEFAELATHKLGDALDEPLRRQNLCAEQACSGDYHRIRALARKAATEPLERTELDRALAAFGAHGYLVWVVEHSPETSPGEVKVQVFYLRDAGNIRLRGHLNGDGLVAFVKSKTQPDGDVLAALAFIRDRWLGEVQW